MAPGLTEVPTLHLALELPVTGVHRPAGSHLRSGGSPARSLLTQVKEFAFQIPKPRDF